MEPEPPIPGYQSYLRQGRITAIRRLVLVFLLAILLLTLFYISIIPNLWTYDATPARRNATLAELSNLSESLQAFHRDTHRFPTATEGIEVLVANPTHTEGWHGPYVNTVPLDKWGHPYIYRYPGKQNPKDYDLSSCGPDGIEGTADDLTKDSR